MQTARRFIQMLRFFMLASIIIYGYIVWRLPSSAHPNPLLFKVLTALSIGLVILIFVMRRLQVHPVESALEVNPNDAAALGQWRQGYVVSYALSEAIVLYGLVLHFLGFPAKRVIPFFVSGFALILFLRPTPLRAREFPPSGEIQP
jgi:hypothetical protein